MILPWSAVHYAQLSIFLATLCVCVSRCTAGCNFADLAQVNRYGTLHKCLRMIQTWITCTSVFNCCSAQWLWPVCAAEHHRCTEQCRRFIFWRRYMLTGQLQNAWPSIEIRFSYHVVCILHTLPNLNTFEIQHNKQPAMHAVQQASHKQSLTYRLWAVVPTYTKQMPTRVLLQSSINLNKFTITAPGCHTTYNIHLDKTAYKDVNRLKSHMRGSFGAILSKLSFPDYHIPCSRFVIQENVHDHNQLL